MLELGVLNTFSWCNWLAFHWAIKHDSRNTERRLFFTSFPPLISWWSCLLCGTWKTFLFYSPCQCLFFQIYHDMPGGRYQSKPAVTMNRRHSLCCFLCTASLNSKGFSFLSAPGVKIPIWVITRVASHEYQCASFFCFLRLFAVPYALIVLKKCLLKWAKLRLICLL